MNEFIGNHIKFIHDYGQSVMALIMTASGVLIYVLLKTKKNFIPRSSARVFASIMPILIFISSLLIFARITIVRPKVGRIIGQLENLKGIKPPELSFVALEKDSVRTMDYYRGKIILVNFWATWCGPCLQEIPDLNRIQKEYMSNGVTVLAISDESKERLTGFNNQHSLSLHIGYLNLFTWADMGSERPVTFLIDRNGKVIDYYTGPHDFAFFSERIKEVL